MFNEAQDTGDMGRAERGRRNIGKFLHRELERRFVLVVETIGVLKADRRRENRYLHKLVTESMKEHVLQYRRIEAKHDDAEDGPAFTPSAETDRYPAAAASRYYIQQASEELKDLLLIHDDREMQAEVIAAGEGIAGKIVDVWDEGEGRKKVPIWIVETDDDLPLRLREDSEVCVVGRRYCLLPLALDDAIVVWCCDDRLYFWYENGGIHPRRRIRAGGAVCEAVETIEE
jgi:hypothetical protein